MLICFCFLNFLNFVDSDLLIALIFFIFFGIICSKLIQNFDFNLILENYIEDISFIKKYNILILYYIYIVFNNVLILLSVIYQLFFFTYMGMLWKVTFVKMAEPVNFLQFTKKCSYWIFKCPWNTYIHTSKLLGMKFNRDLLINNKQRALEKKKRQHDE